MPLSSNSSDWPLEGMEEFENKQLKIEEIYDRALITLLCWFHSVMHTRLPFSLSLLQKNLLVLIMKILIKCKCITVAQCGKTRNSLSPTKIFRQINSLHNVEKSSKPSKSLLLRKNQYFFFQINTFTTEVTKELISRKFLRVL